MLMQQRRKRYFIVIITIMVLFMPIGQLVLQADETDSEIKKTMLDMSTEEENDERDDLLIDERGEDLTGISKLSGEPNEVIEPFQNDVLFEESWQTIEVACEESDQLLQEYLEIKVPNKRSCDGATCYGTTAGDNLRGVSKAVYDIIRPQIEQVAAGNLTSTQMVVTLEELGLRNKMFTAADLGVESVVENGQISAEAMEVLNNRYNYDGGDVMNALVRDCPYEMYWFGNTISYTLLSPYFTKQNGEYCVYYYFDLSLDFLVSRDYGIDDYTIDVAKISKVNNAIENAKQIINYPQIQNYSDMQTLQYYHDRICELNDYNYDVASPSYQGGYGDPWQIIYVFDNDSSTNVVCEGYSKSFGYLCDLTTFDSEEIKAYIVTGMMYFGNGSGPHMWNVIRMDDGQNYMVDITNCDGMCENELFIVPCSSGNVEEGYRLVGSYGVYDYVYDDDTKTLYKGSELTLATEAYVQPQVYNVLFDAVGGQISYTTKNVKNRGPYGELPVPTKLGYVFQGWYTQVDGGTVIQADSIVSLTDDQVLYAHWERLTQIEEFVKRLYGVCLNRTPSQDEVDSWIENIYSGQISGSQATYLFVFSDEFLNKNYCNSCYIKKLYNAIMGREYDQQGLEDWCHELNNGMTREEVFNGFIESPEFGQLCNSYGIQIGNTRVPNSGIYCVGTCQECGEQDNITEFVKRLYSIFLGRSANEQEEKEWVVQFKSGVMSGSQASYCFAFSDEFISKNYCNVCYVKKLYSAILGREYDQQGLDDWCCELRNGMTREDAFNGFIESPEFGMLCEGYGIQRGDTRVPSVGIYCVGNCSECGLVDDVTEYVKRLYNLCLNREADDVGKRDWVNALKAKQKSGAQVAYGFFFSDEFVQQDVHNEGYIQRLYRVMLGREPDEQGLRDWLSEIDKGRTREDIFAEFASSPEYGDVCKRYGIVR